MNHGPQSERQMTTIGIDISKNSFHPIDLDGR